MPPPVKVRFEIGDAQSMDRAFSGLVKRIKELEQAERALTRAEKDRTAAIQQALREQALGEREAAKAKRQAAAEMAAYEREGARMAREKENQLRRDMKAAKELELVELKVKRAAIALQREELKLKEQNERATHRLIKAHDAYFTKMSRKSVAANDNWRPMTARQQHAAILGQLSNLSGPLGGMGPSNTNGMGGGPPPPTWHRRVAGGITGAFGRGIRNTIRSVTGIAAGLGIGAGTYMLGGAMREAIEIDEMDRVIVNTTRERDGTANFKVGELSGRAYKLGAGNVKANPLSILKAYKVAADRGGGSAGVKAFLRNDEWALRTGLAMGATAENIGEYAAVASKLALTDEDFKAVFKSSIQMANEGDLEFAETVKEMRKLKGLGLQFTTGPGAIRNTVAMTQAAAEFSGSPQQAVSSVTDLLREYQTVGKVKKMVAAGIDVVDPKTQSTRDPIKLTSEVLDLIYNKKNPNHEKYLKLAVASRGLKFDPSKIEQMQGAAWGYTFTGASQKIATGMRDVYLRGYKGRDGRTYSGKEAVNKRYEDILEATISDKGVEESDKNRQTSTAAKLEQAHAELTKAMETALPAVSRLATKFAEMAPNIGKGIEYVADNPGKSVGMLFGAKVSADVIGMAIAGAMKKTLESTFDNWGKGFMEQKAANGLGAALGTALGQFTAITLAATTVYLTGKSIIDDAAEDAFKKGKKHGDAVDSLDKITKELANGDITPTEAAARAAALDPTLASTQKPQKLFPDVTDIVEPSKWDTLTSAMALGGGLGVPLMGGTGIPPTDFFYGVEKNEWRAGNAGSDEDAVRQKFRETMYSVMGIMEQYGEACKQSMAKFKDVWPGALPSPTTTPKSGARTDPASR